MSLSLFLYPLSQVTTSTILHNNVAVDRIVKAFHDLHNVSVLKLLMHFSFRECLWGWRLSLKSFIVGVLFLSEWSIVQSFKLSPYDLECLNYLIFTNVLPLCNVRISYTCEVGLVVNDFWLSSFPNSNFYFRLIVRQCCHALISSYCPFSVSSRQWGRL